MRLRLDEIWNFAKRRIDVVVSGTPWVAQRIFVFSYAMREKIFTVYLECGVTNFQRCFARRNAGDIRRHRCVQLDLLGRRRQPRSPNARESTRPEAAGGCASAHGSVHDPPLAEWPAAVFAQYYLEDGVFVMSRRAISIITSRVYLSGSLNITRTKYHRADELHADSPRRIYAICHVDFKKIFDVFKALLFDLDLDFLSNFCIYILNNFTSHTFWI